MKKITLLFALALSVTALTGQNKQTEIYYTDDSTSLEMDVFLPDSLVEGSPLFIFVHGGGFSGGNRGGGNDICQYMASNGIPAATITYTLYMKGKNFSCEGILSEKVKAIQLAAYQTRIATTWFIERSDEYGIDTNKIFIGGSSAGAEAVLQAAYWDTSAVNFYPNTLSPSFKYAGLVSGAGALLDINMITEYNKIPTICFHGTCDPLVPYHIAPHHYCSQIASGYMMMFGGLAIYERLCELNESTQLMSYCGDGHKHAGTPFHGAEMQTVLEFMTRSLNGEKMNIHRIFKNSEECAMGLDFVFCY